MRTDLSNGMGGLDFEVSSDEAGCSASYPQTHGVLLAISLARS
jgi:hypothetical protein